MTLPELEALRRAIDETDRRLLSLVAERVRLVLQVGDLKRREGIAVHDPSRERALLDRLSAEPPPPLDAQTITRVFERIVEESRRLEQRHVDR